MPSYLMFSICVSSSRTFPSVVNAVMYVAVLPSNSVVFNATIASSLVPGINLNEEKPNFG